MAFLTKANLLSIMSDVDVRHIKVNDEEIYEKPIYILNQYEKQKLIGIQGLLSDPANFTKHKYKKIIKSDSFSYIYEGGIPAYHLDEHCDKLKLDFTNFELPSEIKEKGEDEIKKFRNWFKQNMYLLDKPDVFKVRLELAFGLKNAPESIDHLNSGVEKIENLNLNELKSRVDGIISRSAKYFNESGPRKKEVIKRYTKNTYLGFSKQILNNNDTGFDDETIKKFLREYDKHFKKPLKLLLIQFYRVKLNPKLSFEGKLLEQLGFKLCSNCYKNSIITTKNNDT